MKKTLTIIATMLALPVFAQLQMVDITTLTTNTIIHTVYPGILFTNFSTNAWVGYSTVNTNEVQIGDSPNVAFGKINTNFLSISNSLAALSPTNFLAAGAGGNTDGSLLTNTPTSGLT